MPPDPTNEHSLDTIRLVAYEVKVEGGGGEVVIANLDVLESDMWDCTPIDMVREIRDAAERHIKHYEQRKAEQDARLAEMRKEVF